MRFHHIQNGCVINTIEADSVDAIPGATLLPADAGGQIGDLWDGKSFTTAAEANPKRITRLAFRNRFTDAEKAALYTAAVGSAALRAYIDDVNAATYIDLARADTIAGVEALEMASIIGVGRATQILNGPVQPHEVWMG